MTFTLLPLPFSPDALAPHMSAETVTIHHGRHHRGYVDTTNRLALELGQEHRSLVELIQGDIEGALLSNAGQLWNHNFFWKCLSPVRSVPEGRLADLVNDAFGSTEGLSAAFQAAAKAHFGSGWVWLLLDQGSLRIASLHDGDTPASLDQAAPLLAVDVWEHAYYLDYRQDREGYVATVLENLANWDFAAANLDGQGFARADQAAAAASPLIKPPPIFRKA